MSKKAAPLSIIAALSVVLVLLAVGLVQEFTAGGLFGFGKPAEGAGAGSAGGAPDSPTEPTEPGEIFDPYRSARLSLSDALDLEINLGGSGTEEKAAVIAANGAIYAFINTDSDDFDADGADGRPLGIILDPTLHITGRAFLGSDGEKLESAVLAEGGIMCAFSADGKVSALRLYSFDLALLRETEVGGALPSEFSALLPTDSGGCALISSSAVSPLEKRRLLFRLYSPECALVWERTISSAYSLSYLDCFEAPSGAFTLFFNGVADIGSLAGAARLDGDHVQPTITTIAGAGDFRAERVAPMAGGWVMPVIYRGGDGGLLLLSENFEKLGVRFSGVNSPQSADLFFANGVYYTAFYGESETAVTAFDETFESGRAAEELSAMSRIYGCLSGKGHALFACGDGTALYALSPAAGIKLKFGTSAESGLILLRLGDFYYAAAITTAQSADVGGCFGSADLWIARLRI